MAKKANNGTVNGTEGVPESELYPGEAAAETAATTEAAAPAEQQKGGRQMAKKTAKGGAAKGGRKGAVKGAAKGGARKQASTGEAPRRSRTKVVSGALVRIQAQGTTYLALEFEEGKIVLTPTSNREPNRDLAVKALKALLK